MRRPALWLGSFAGLTALGLFFFTQDLARTLYWSDPTPWWRYLVSWLVGLWTVGLLVPGVLALARRWPIERASWPRRVALHAACSLVFAAVVVGVVSALDATLGFVGAVDTTGLRATALLNFALSAHNDVVAYWTVVAIHHSYRYYRTAQERRLHASRLEAELARAQLAALKAQLQPHFLFNTLNAIIVLVRQQRGPAAEDMLERLSELLRLVLDDVATHEVPLHRELDHLRLYLGIEQVRFADRLHVEIDAPAAVLDAQVPHLALQPIVENALRHGIGASRTAGRLAIRATRVGDALEVVVSDDGPGLGAATAGGHGIGLANTRARLAQLYGDRASLELAAGATSGVAVTLTLPFRIEAACAS